MRDLFILGSAHAWPEVLQFIGTCDCGSRPDGPVDALPARRRTVATWGCCPRIDNQQHLYNMLRASGSSVSVRSPASGSSVIWPQPGAVCAVTSRVIHGLELLVARDLRERF